MKISRVVHFSLSFSVIAIMALGLSGCDLAKNQLQADRSGGLELQDYKDLSLIHI